MVQQQQQQAAIKLRWANKQSSQGNNGAAVPPTTTLVKSLPEIQAEKAAQIALLREKEDKERANQQAQFNLAFAGAWGASHGSISGSGGFVWA